MMLTDRIGLSVLAYDLFRQLIVTQNLPSPFFQEHSCCPLLSAIQRGFGVQGVLLGSWRSLTWWVFFVYVCTGTA